MFGTSFTHSKHHPASTQRFRRVACEATNIAPYHWYLEDGIEVEHVWPLSASKNLDRGSLRDVEKDVRKRVKSTQVRERKKVSHLSKSSVSGYTDTDEGVHTWNTDMVLIPRREIVARPVADMRPRPKKGAPCDDERTNTRPTVKHSFS